MSCYSCQQKTCDCGANATIRYVDSCGRCVPEPQRAVVTFDSLQILGTDLITNSTTSIKLKTSGLANHTLTADVNLDTSLSNQLSVLTTGLFVSKGAGLEVLSTNAISLGVAAGILTASLKLDPDPSNILTISQLGLKATIVSNANLSVTNTTSLNLVLNAGVLSGTVKLSPDSDNVLVLASNGLKAAVNAIGSVTDTNSLDLTLNSGNLSGVVKLDPDPNNLLTASANGLRVMGSMAVVDTATIDLTLTSGSLTAAVKIDPVSSNALTVNSNGLSVSRGANLTTTSSQSLVLTNSSGNLIGSVVIDTTDANNILTVGINGLKAIPNIKAINPQVDLLINPQFTYNVTSGILNLKSFTGATNILAGEVGLVPKAQTSDNTKFLKGDGTWGLPSVGNQTPVTVNDSSSIDLTASGLDNHTLTGSIKVSTQAGNIVVINTDGLYVPTPGSISETPLSVVDTNSIDFNTSGTSSHILTGSVKISTSVGNALQVQPSGLFVPNSNSGISSYFQVLEKYEFSPNTVLAGTYFNTSSNGGTYFVQVPTGLTCTLALAKLRITEGVAASNITFNVKRNGTSVINFALNAGATTGTTYNGTFASNLAFSQDDQLTVEIVGNEPSLGVVFFLTAKYQ